jgi:hypothetical protein
MNVMANDSEHTGKTKSPESKMLASRRSHHENADAMTSQSDKKLQDICE